MERIEEEAVDGEVAAADVFFGALGVADGVGVAAVGIGAVGAEGGDLCLCVVGLGRFGIICFGGRVRLTEGVGYEDDSEVGAYGEGAGEEIEDDVGGGAGGYIVVGGGAAEEEIADAAAGEVGLVGMGAEGADDVEGRFELGVGGVHRFA